MKNLYEKIIDLENIRNAYLDLAEKLDEKNKTNKYSGIDGAFLRDFDINSEEIFLQIQQELVNFSPITKVIQYSIPKSSGNGNRNIFIYTVKERIKAQAIYRVVEPYFEEEYSEFLFSYRKTQPSYFASRSAVRRYKRNYGKDTVLLMDFTSYSDFINHNILIEKLKKFEFDEKTLKFLELFIKAEPYTKNLEKKDFGLMQGVPLIALFANIYLNDMDKEIGRLVQFYRRVGDDFMLADPNYEKIVNLYNRIVEIGNEHKLVLKKEKVKLINNKEEFNFLGYTFLDKKISIKESGVKRLIKRWEDDFNCNKFADKPSYAKEKFIKYMFTRAESNYEVQFKLIIKQYMMVDNDEQIKDLYRKFIKILTKFLFKKYNERNNRLTLELIEKLKIKSLYKHYLDQHKKIKNKI